jgi:hypothetical protein
MALGLLGLQPALFTNFLMGTQSKTAAYGEGTQQPQVLDSYKEWAAGQLTSLLTNGHLNANLGGNLAGNVGGPQSTPSGWAPQPVVNMPGAALPSTSPTNFNANQYAAAQYNQAYTQPNGYVQSGYAAPPTYQQQQQYGQQQQYAQPTYNQPTQQPYYPQSQPYNVVAQQPYTQPAAAGGNAYTQNQAAYMAQANTPYGLNGATAAQTAPHAYSNGGYNTGYGTSGLNGQPGAPVYGQPNAPLQQPYNNYYPTSTTPNQATSWNAFGTNTQYPNTQYANTPYSNAPYLNTQYPNTYTAQNSPFQSFIPAQSSSANNAGLSRYPTTPFVR